MTRIVLAVMVKNEARVIERMLESTLHVIDAIVLMDTGSTDDTIWKVRDFAWKYKIPLTVASSPWESFCENRNRLLNAARTAAADLGGDPWLLLLDADHVLSVDYEHIANGVQLPGVEAISLWQISSSMRYVNARLVRASIDASYIGRTHEYLELGVASTATMPETFKIIDREDGGCRADKFTRDETLLRLDLADKPDDARSLFYLGWTLRCLGRYDEAISIFEKRLSLPWHEQERWYTQYELAKCHALARHEHEVVVAAFGKAFGMRPWRAEALYDLAKYYMDRCTDADRIAASYIALAGQRIQYPANDTLFVDEIIYKWGFQFILSICFFYLKDDRGMTHCDYLRLSRGSPYKGQAIKNAIWYTKPLETLKTLDVPFVPEQGWHACNPSIIAHDDGYIISVRTVNYLIDDEFAYQFDGIIKTRTFVIRVDRDFAPVGAYDELRSPPSEQSVIRGIEDVRLYRVNPDGSIEGLGNRSDWGGELSDGRSLPRMYRCHWDDEGTLLACAPLDVRLGRCEKNWMPWTPHDGSVLAIYGHNPVVVLDVVSGGEPVSRSETELDLSSFRGSAAPIQWDDGWLYVIHETSAPEKATYLHRFCWMDAALKLKKISRLFYFEKCGIEFCAGMAPHASGAVLTYGVHDAVAKIAVIDRVVIDAMLDAIDAR